MPAPESPSYVAAEMQGLYGPFTLDERVLQKIWAQSDFSRRNLTLNDGRPLEIISPGRWNRLGGPDFTAARLRIAGTEVCGEVEVHFHASDWTAHGHVHDRAYDNVVLHVLLYPPAPGAAPVLNHAATPLPTFVLLPYLLRDLEDYAADDALESLTGRDEWELFSPLAEMHETDLLNHLHELAHSRWQRKVAQARATLQHHSWEHTAHRTALEILGYSRNRGPMLALADRHPLREWRTAPDVSSFQNETPNDWQSQGIRPANQPRRRLAQYAAWVSACPDWPTKLISATSAWAICPIDSLRTRDIRRQFRLADTWRDLAHTIGADALGATRWRTLVGDGFLPLLTAQTGHDFSGNWFHAPPGDCPALLLRALRRLGVAGSTARPHAHGWTQGLLAWSARRH